MSHENVEILRRAVDGFERGDRTAWFPLLDEDYEITPVSDWPNARAIRGREAGWNFYRDIAETLKLGSAYVELVAAGGAKAFVHQRQAGRGLTSGADVQLDPWRVVTFREGKVLRYQWFTDWAEAVGLSE